MEHYKVILNEGLFDQFIDTLPDLLPHEVWYACLFGRPKYDASFPNTRDSGRLARIIARNREELKEKLADSKHRLARTRERATLQPEEPR
jgi:hypothetical protein